MKKLNTIQNEYPVLWDDLIDLKNEIYHWKDRLEFYNDEAYLNKNFVIAQLEFLMAQIDLIKTNLNKNEYEKHFYGENFKPNFLMACIKLDKALSECRIPSNYFPEVAQAHQEFKYAMEEI